MGKSNQLVALWTVEFKGQSLECSEMESVDCNGNLRPFYGPKKWRPIFDEEYFFTEKEAMEFYNAIVNFPVLNEGYVKVEEAYAPSKSMISASLAEDIRKDGRRYLAPNSSQRV